ncbi:MAG: cytochrome c oxidase accessory protein CcoG [Phycisphaerales bacterium]
MKQDFTLPQLNERVLSTLNTDGSRRWMTPREARGRLWKARLIVAWSLIAVFTAIPWLRIDGKPPIFLDVMTRQFTFFGTTFRPTETLLMALLFLAIFVTIFLLTALFGRVWCGWGCPQTVYLEFVYRPIERFFLGQAYGRKGATVAVWRRIAMYAVFLVLSAHLANTFLAYFVGTDRLTHWTLGNPAEHPVAFAVFAVTVGLMMFDFVFFREQLCTLVCPYGRFQSVLLDRESLVIGYDRRRGEPRAKAAERRALESKGERAGDCIECTMCVQVCPTGIDIRDGLQLECVNCTQCIDACNEVMDKIGKPRGLIRYSSQNQLEKGTTRRLRYRVLIYPALLVVILSVFVTMLVRREPALIEQERIRGANFTEMTDGRIETPISILVENRGEVPRTYTATGVDDVQVVGGSAQATVQPGQPGKIALRVSCPPRSFGRGSRQGEVEVRDDAGFVKRVPLTIAGPFSAGGGK